MRSANTNVTSINQNKNSYILSIHEQICCLQISMDDVVLMQILHSFANINRKLQQLRELQYIMVLMQVIIETSSMHKLCKQEHHILIEDFNETEDRQANKYRIKYIWN